MAHKKGLGSSRNGRDSQSQRLGVKVFAGQTVTGGEIIRFLRRVRVSFSLLPVVVAGSSPCCLLNSY